MHSNIETTTRCGVRHFWKLGHSLKCLLHIFLTCKADVWFECIVISISTVCSWKRTTAHLTRLIRDLHKTILSLKSDAMMGPRLIPDSAEEQEKKDQTQAHEKKTSVRPWVVWCWLCFSQTLNIALTTSLLQCPTRSLFRMNPLLKSHLLNFM